MEIAELTVMEMAETATIAEAVTEVRVVMASLQQDQTDHLKIMLHKEATATDLLTLLLPAQADHQAVAMVAAAVVAVADHQAVAAADAVVETKLICI